MLRQLGVAAFMLVLVAAVACGGSEAPSTSAPPTSPAGTPAGQRVDESKASTISGRIVWDGAAPKNELQRLSADPVCVRENKGATRESEAYVVSDGGLENVFVYVKDGLGNYVFDVPTEKVVLDQHGCRYEPHVFGVRIGQPLEAKNSDPTLHNVHALPKNNAEFNAGQPIQGMTNTFTFTAKEVMVPLKCEVHGWMNAYIGVLDHPYFAVSGDGGKFDLKTLPAGKYTIEAWHEKLGPQTQEVTIGENETKEVTFTFKSAT
jgi:plastocyanin